MALFNNHHYQKNSYIWRYQLLFITIHAHKRVIGIIMILSCVRVYVRIRLWIWLAIRLTCQKPEYTTT